MKNRYLLTAALLASTAILATPAFAAESPAELSRQLQMLQDQLRSVQQQLETLKSSDQAQKDAIAQEVATREASEKAARDAALAAGGTLVFQNGKSVIVPPANPKVVESGSHSFTLSSADGNWSIQPTGRIHMDMGGYISQKAAGTTGPGTTAGGKLSGGVNARRARFGVTGKAMGDFTYSIILEAGGTNDGAATYVAPATTTCATLPCTVTTPAVAVTSQLVNTASIGYTGIKNTIIEAGYFAQFFTLDESTSSNNIMFMERATPVTVASSVNTGDPRFGAGFRTWESNWWFGAYMTASQPGAIKNLTDRGIGAYQRATFNPIQNDTQSLHVGVGAAELFQVPTGNGPNTTAAATITLSDRPELRIDGTQLLSTGGLGTVANPVTGVQIYTAEAAAAFGSLFAQGEFFHYNVNRRGRPAAKFDGGYMEASYTFGGRRTYAANCGCYSGVTPVTPFNPLKGGMGAFEIAGRVSYIDLVDKFNSSLTTAQNPAFAVNGGRQTNYTAGLNWYWNSNMLWKLNYIHTNFRKATAVRVAQSVELDAIAARFQIMF